MTQYKKLPLILVDGSSYLYRAYHVMQNFSNQHGQPTGAIYGVINMLRSLRSTYNPTHLAVVFDAPGGTFRDTLYADYKAHRPPMPDDLKQQVTPLYNMIKALGIPLLVIDGVEADDVIGTLAVQAATAGEHVLISTGDKDMTQLVDEHITLINTMTNVQLDAEKVRQKYGVPPTAMVDLLALMGDSADNIPGIPGIGIKTAQQLLQKYGTLKNIFADIESIPQLSLRGAKSVALKLTENKASAMLSYQLAKIKTDVELAYTYDQLQIFAIDAEQLRQLFVAYDFNRWLSELDKQQLEIDKHELTPSCTDSQDGEAIIKAKPCYQTIFTEAELAVWINKIKQSGLLSIDVETDSVNSMTANLVGISLAVKAGEGAYIPLAHDYLDAPLQLSIEYVLSQLKPLLEQSDIIKIGQNFKFDYTLFARYDIVIKGMLFDTMLESYLLNSTAGHHDMSSLALRYLQHQVIEFSDVAGKGKQKISFNQVSIENATQYAAEDADITLQLHQKLWPKIIAEPELETILQQLELPLFPILSRMERRGVLINSAALLAYSVELGKKLNELEIKAHEYAGETFNLSSPKQLQRILYEKQQLPVLKKTPAGVPSTDEAVLTQLALQSKLAEIILTHRHLAKLKTTYSDALPKLVHSVTGRVHTSYHQAVAVTGRLSSREPNLQNIPIKTEEGKRIRQAVIAPADYVILAADYSQIELRIMAHFSQDARLLAAFANNQDIHQATAAEIFSISIDSVNAEQRRSAKAINFGLIYGMSAFGVARQLGISNSQAKHYIARYFTRYPGVANYMEKTRQQALEYGYVKTLAGRRLYLPDMQARQVIRRKAAEREAINAPMQGSAADIIKQAMINIDQWLSNERVNSIYMIMQVHDELVFEIHKSAIAVATDKIRYYMESAVTLSIPLCVNIGIGNNWDEAH